MRSRGGLQCLPGPCQSCRSGWRWWLEKRWLAEYEERPCPGPSLLLPNPGSLKGGLAGQSPGLPRSDPARQTHHPRNTTWMTAGGTSGTWLQHHRAPGETSKGQLSHSESGKKARGAPPAAAPTAVLTCWSLSMWARQSSRSLSPGTTTVPRGTAGGQRGLSAASCMSLLHVCRQPRSRSPRPARALPPLTGLPELLLVVMQSLVVVHADPAHLDPQLLGNRLLTVEGPRTGNSARTLPRIPVLGGRKARC